MSQIPPNVRPPTPEEIREYADAHHMSLSDDEVADFVAAIEGTLELYERLDELPEPVPERRFTERDPGYRPDAEEDPLNAVVRHCEVPGASTGPLSGYDVGLKDNVALAGVQMTCGSRLFEGYVPERDATVVTRLLDAGATITAKLNMEDMAFSGSGELSATGPVLNPRDRDHIAGGSSSGSIAAVVDGTVDVAIGGDQGGSIRIPAAWSGGVGHKPTHSLVPYTGVVGLGHTFDHVGPMATTVADCARVLDAIAGKDPDDPRQGAVPTEPTGYLDALDDDPSSVTVGVVGEGFDREESEEHVDEAVQEALDEFEAAGATVEDVSVPMHRDGLAIWNGIVNEETAALVRGEGVGHFGDGYYDTQFAETFGRARRAQADDYLTTLKLTLILGEYLGDQYRGRYHARAQNLGRELAERYDEALADVDVLAMPTTPQTAHERRDHLTRLEVLQRALAMLGNTAPFDVTGHPAISVPAGEPDGLPAGLMLVGERFDDATVLAAARAYEDRVGWAWQDG
jgi:amidase